MVKNRASSMFNILGLVGILDTIFVLALNGGINLGTLLPGVLGVTMLLWGSKRDYLRQHVLKDHFLRLRQLVRLGIVVLLASFILIESLLLYNTKDSLPSRVDYLIILGAGLNGDKLSWTLWERVENGLRILQINKDMRVVVSGGKGPGVLMQYGSHPTNLTKSEVDKTGWPQADLAISWADLTCQSRPACGLIELCMIFPLDPVHVGQSAVDAQKGRAFGLRITGTLASPRGPWPPPARSPLAFPMVGAPTPAMNAGVSGL